LDLGLQIADCGFWIDVKIRNPESKTQNPTVVT